jgi:hypothetical protein
MKPLLTFLLVVGLGALQMLQAADPRPVEISETPFESASVRQSVLVLKLKGAWLVDGTRRIEPGEELLVGADSKVKLVDRHTQVVVSFQPARGVLIDTTFDARSLGGKIEHKSEILAIR